MPYASAYSKSFPKDWGKLTRSGRYNMQQLKSVMMQLIAGDTPLGMEFKDHQLTGSWLGYRECHIGGDFLLIYQIYEEKMIFFSRVGTHSELFKI
ncbi:MAG: type II toxin-antitoxin system YafQ family toxin [Synergistaceae bacterium]|jgi:mRNA interferase YafQ|nr:type II toxin-antitoxin system YafQ family toxin [Synergistaceae bacterium]